jgi:phosphate-selective porin OprO/OprP
MNKLYCAVLISALFSTSALATINANPSDTNTLPTTTMDHSKEIKALKAQIKALDKKIKTKNKEDNNTSSAINMNSDKLKIGFDGEFQANRNFVENTGKSASAYINAAKVSLKGRISPEWGYKFMVDFADEDVGTDNTDLKLGNTMIKEDFAYAPKVSRKVSIKDANIQFYGFHPVVIAIGRMFPDMSISHGEMFLETPALGGLLPINRNGIYVSTHGDAWYASTTFTHSGPSSTDSKDDVNMTWYRKLAVAPIKTKDNLLHIGGSWVTKFPKTNNYSTTDFNQRPENGLGSVLVGTAYLNNIQRTETWMADTAYQHGPALISAEYARTNVKRYGVKNSKFDGWYAQGSYVLTGESKAYDISCPSFSDIEPSKPFDLKNNQYGAFEVKYRYSTVNYGLNQIDFGSMGLDDANKLGVLASLTGSRANGLLLNMNGGKMMMHTLGVNWILNNNLMFMVDYSFGKIKNSQVWGAFYLLDTKTPSATTFKPNYNPKILMFKAKLKI